MASIHPRETANFTRLGQLIIDKGTEALRMTFDRMHPPANLPVILRVHKSALQRIKHSVINVSQWNLLFPPSGNPPDSKTFDTTLLAILLRNICGLPSPATGWNLMPLDTDKSISADIVRIKLFRNQYTILPSARVDEITFEDLWRQISSALIRLGIPQQAIDDLKTGSSGNNQ